MSRKKTAPPEIAGYVDTHFHILQSIKRGLTPAEILDSAFDSGMIFGIDIATGLEAIEERLAYADSYPGLFFTVGCYPSLAENPLPETLEAELERQTGLHAKIVAVGEIGLDYHWNFGTPERQKELLRRQIAAANRLELPVVIHCRDTQTDLVEVLKGEPPVKSGIIHCFAGDYEFAQACLDLNMKISFAGNMTYKNAGILRDVLKRIPISSLLLETDAPYLAPEPSRGRLNTPQLIRHTYRTAAEIRGISLEQLTEKIRRNTVEIFNLPE